MELGHLAPKADDVTDPKKLCRLFGGLIAKLESKHVNSQNLLATVRKVNFTSIS